MGLCLTRRLGQKILIGDDIVITLASIDGNKVRLDIVAPKSVAVDREEVRKDKLVTGVTTDGTR